MNRDQITNIRIPFNYVLVKMIDKEKTVSINNEEYYMDPTFESQDHVPTRGEVIVTPQRLIYGKSRGNSMEWDTEMMIERGDIVYFDYLEAVKAFGRRYNYVLKENQVEEMYWDVEGDLYFFVPYSECFCIKTTRLLMYAPHIITSDNMYAYMLNGYVLVDPEDDESIASEVLTLDKKRSKRIGRVILSGVPNLGYMNRKYYDDPVKKGDRVLIGKFTGREMENKYHSTFDGDKRYYPVQLRWIDAVLPEGRIGVCE